MNYKNLYTGDTVVRRDGTQDTVLELGRDRKYDNADLYPQTPQTCPIWLHTTRGQEWLTESLNVVDGYENKGDIVTIYKANGSVIVKG